MSGNSNKNIAERKEPYILVREATKKGYVEAFKGDSINVSYPNSKTKRGRVGKEVSQTLLTSPNIATVVESPKTSSSAAILISEDGKHLMKIRKLTPLECWRLMGFDDEDFSKVKSIGISDSQAYKQAGNSIVVNVLEAILKKLFG